MIQGPQPHPPMPCAPLVHSMSFFVVPTFVPPTLEQLPTEPDEVSLIVKQEARITAEVRRGVIAVPGGPSAALGKGWEVSQLASPSSRLVRCSSPRCGTTTERQSPWG